MIKYLPIHGRWDNAATIIQQNASNLGLVSPQSLNFLASPQVPDQNESIHTTRNNSTFWVLAIRRNPRQGPDKARVAQQYSRGLILPPIGRTQRPHPYCPVPGGRRNHITAKDANPPNLVVTIKLRQKTIKFCTFKSSTVTVSSHWSTNRNCSKIHGAGPKQRNHAKLTSSSWPRSSQRSWYTLWSISIGERFLRIWLEKTKGGQC